MRFFEFVSNLVRVIGLIFWRTVGLILVVVSFALTMRELSLLGQTEEIDTVTEISVRLGMHPSMGMLLLISFIGTGILFLVMPVRRRRPARR